jgi:ATP-binding protein involved in chromosome partitioning
MSIKKIIAFGSAKGGVGKSSITASIGISLSKKYKVGILDADIYGPNQDILFSIDKRPKYTNKGIIKPVKKNNIKIMSMGFILEQNKAATWRGPLLSNAIKQLIHSTKWGDLDYLLIDMPPGTGDAYLTVFKELSIDFFILISTPSNLSFVDSKRTLAMIDKLNIITAGYIENDLLNTGDSSKNKSLNIEKLGSFKYHKDIYDFNTDYNCSDADKISNKIEDM